MFKVGRPKKEEGSRKTRWRRRCQTLVTNENVFFLAARTLGMQMHPATVRCLHETDNCLNCDLFDYYDFGEISLAYATHCVSTTTLRGFFFNWHTCSPAGKSSKSHWQIILLPHFFGLRTPVFGLPAFSHWHS